MPKDNVIRTQVDCTWKGVRAKSIIDTIDRGDVYQLVLEWVSFPNTEGEFPKRSVHIKKDVFRVHSDLSRNFELECPYYIDFDKMDWTDRDGDALRVWERPAEFSYPRPDDHAGL